MNHEYFDWAFLADLLKIAPPKLRARNFTVLQNTRVDFEYDVLSAVFTDQTCMSIVMICYVKGWTTYKSEITI